MKDIVADKILSWLFANNIRYRQEKNALVIPIENDGNIINIYYINKKFYIDKSNYVGQPHIILRLNPKNEQDIDDIDKYGLCLTMNGSDRRNNELTAEGEWKRVKEIVFELWDDPIYERFREINTTFQTKSSKELYIDSSGIITDIESEEKYNKVKKMTIDFNGQTKDEIINIIDTKFPSLWVLVKIKCKNETKKILLSEGRDMYKLNDFTNESFWDRTGRINGKKIAIIIGLGSIGGLVLDHLCKIGFKEITIYDNDEFDVVNNPRHVLGIKPNQIGLNKAKHLSDHYSKLYPMIEIKAVPKKFEYNSVVPKNVLIFNTTGGSHYTLLLNSCILYNANKEKNFSFIDIFVEPFALGIHGIVFEYSKDSKKIEWPLRYLNNERYIVTPKKDFRKNFDGCFTPTLPYGFAPLQIAVPWLLIKMQKNNFNGCHYTIPFLSLFPEKSVILNDNLSKSINPYKIGVKIWKK